jgi:hypothetical protein
MGNGSWSNQTSRRIIIVVGTPFSGLFFYDPAPAAGTLVGSWTVQAGSDPYGNGYPAGITIWDTSGNRIGNWSSGGLQLINANNAAGTIISGNGSANSTPTLIFHSNNAVSGLSAFIEAIAQSPTTEAFVISGPRSTLNNENPQSFVFVQLTSAGTTANGASGNIYWGNTAAGTSAVLTADKTGCNIVGSVTATLPGSLPPAPETWHTPVLASGWASVGAAPVRYRLEGIGAGVVRLAGELTTTGAGPWPAATTLFTVTAPAQKQKFVNNSSIAVTAGQSTVNVDTSGNVTNGQTFTAAGQFLTLDGITLPLD